MASPVYAQNPVQVAPEQVTVYDPAPTAGPDAAINSQFQQGTRSRRQIVQRYLQRGKTARLQKVKQGHSQIPNIGVDVYKFAYPASETPVPTYELYDKYFSGEDR